MRPLVAHCHAGLSALRRAAGDPRGAAAHLPAASALYRELGMTRWLERAATVAGVC
jgi:hypothetical protein